MKKKNVKLLLGAITLSTLFVTVPVGADTLDLGDDAPTSGSITLDDNDQIVESSSSYFLNSAEPSEKSDSVTPFRAINYANSRWVYYSNRHIGKGTKTGNSNYYHQKKRHGSYAAVGSKKSGWKKANAKKYSYAKATGPKKSTFVAKYDAPYR